LDSFLILRACAKKSGPAQLQAKRPHSVVNIHFKAIIPITLNANVLLAAAVREMQEQRAQVAWRSTAPHFGISAFSNSFGGSQVNP
jgi:hypothetical protein